MTETRQYYGLSYRERTVLEAIRDYVADHGYPPSHREIADDPERLEAFRVGRAWLIPEHAAREFRPLPPHRPRKRRVETR